jgi:hypothetical protein
VRRFYNKKYGTFFFPAVGHIAKMIYVSLYQIKAIEKLVIGKEIDLEELEGRANQAQIQKVCVVRALVLIRIFIFCAN